MGDGDELLTVEEAAETLKVSRKTLYAWVSQGKVPYKKLGALVRFSRGELTAWVAKHSHGGA
ncbi:helix-turn-helix domain-containing protein [Archangium lansingense]|uniref:helix-turn-helix domain-containing protein n=1 Tax=Archangium lansingense TaxID=2995310 RepID=UPI003B8047AE